MSDHGQLHVSKPPAIESDTSHHLELVSERGRSRNVALGAAANYFPEPNNLIRWNPQIVNGIEIISITPLGPPEINRTKLIYQETKD